MSIIAMFLAAFLVVFVVVTVHDGEYGLAVAGLVPLVVLVAAVVTGRRA